MSLPTVSVVICAFTMRRWARLVAAVESVRRQTLPPQEVIVVVDHCDELLMQASSLGDDVRVVANMATPGLSGARNTGVAAAGGDVVAFLDDDATASSEWLARLTRDYIDPHVVGVGGYVAPGWERPCPRWFPPEFRWVVGCSYRGQPTVTAPVRNPIGAGMSFRRSPVLAVGGFSSGLGRVGAGAAGCEETELSIRLAHAFPRTKILHEPSAVVRHHVPAERARWSYFSRRCFAEGRSKARVRTLARSRLALASERAYVTRTLPTGVLRSIRATAGERDLAAITPALAIVAGLTITAAGYVTESSRRWRPPAPRRRPKHDTDQTQQGGIDAQQPR